MYIDKVKDQIKLPQNLKIFDTTLRDGEQTPGVALTVDEKIQIAEKLDSIGVDTIEFGFPAVSEGEMKTAKDLVEYGLNSNLCGLARANKSDIDAIIDCDVDYAHIFIATSQKHREKKLNLDKQSLIKKVQNSIEYAKGHGLFIEFSCEDATRTDLDFLLDVYRTSQEYGADILNIPDTVGVMTPSSMKYLMENLCNNLTKPLSVHCHDDFGLSVANSIAAVESGISQVHVTVNGLGERAGNTSLEELVMALITIYGLNLNIKTKNLYDLSEFVSKLTGVRLPPNKAITGENAFAHESGIHVQGIIKDSKTYEALNPELVGHNRRIVLGKHTGFTAIKSKLDDYDFIVDDTQLCDIYTQIKNLGDKGKQITDADFKSITITTISKAKNERVKLLGLSVMTGLGFSPTATVKLQIDDEIRETSKIGVGPIDAALLAIQDLVKDFYDLELQEYSINSITSGANALADIFVLISDKNNNVTSGRATSDDVVMASVNAVLDSINKLFMIDDYINTP